MPATFHEMLIKGDYDKVYAYVNGYLLGKGMKSGYLFSREHAFEIQHLRELIKYHGEVVHLLCTSSVRTAVVRAINNAPEQLRFEIKKTQPVSRAYFEFKFEVFNRKIAAQLKRMMKTMPKGVTVCDYAPHEEVSPEGAGVEAYAPMHDYVFRGSGVVEGDPVGVLKTHEKFADHDHIQVSHIDVHH